MKINITHFKNDEHSCIRHDNMSYRIKHQYDDDIRQLSNTMSLNEMHIYLQLKELQYEIEELRRDNNAS